MLTYQRQTRLHGDFIREVERRITAMRPSKSKAAGIDAPNDGKQHPNTTEIARTPLASRSHCLRAGAASLPSRHLFHQVMMPLSKEQ